MTHKKHTVSILYFGFVVIVAAKVIFFAGIFAGDKSNEASIRVMRPFSELEADHRTHIIHSEEREWQRMEKDTTVKQKKNTNLQLWFAWIQWQ